MKRKTMINFLKSLAGMSDEEAVQTVQELELGKAGGVGHAETLTSGERVADLWREGELHKTPGREVVNVGPGQASSGGGAEAMVREYSRTAPQKGVQIEAEKLGEELGSLRATMKAMAEAMAGFTVAMKTNTAAVALLVKAKETEDDEEDEESEVVEINESKAKALFARAKAMLDRAETAKALADEMDDPEAAKAKRVEGRALRKSAARLLLKARDAAIIGKQKDICKAIKDLIAGNRFLKADINVVQEEEDEDDEETGKARLPAAPVVPAAAKGGEADKNAKGNQVDRQNPENGNQDSAAKAGELNADEIRSQLAAALKGNTVLEGKINTIMDALAGKSISAAPQTVPILTELMKGDVNVIATQISDRIEDGIDGGSLNDAAAMRARDLLSKFTAVRKGTLTEATFKDMLAVAPQAVKDIFAVAA